jgi:hypothetical protein
LSAGQRQLVSLGRAMLRGSCRLLLVLYVCMHVCMYVCMLVVLHCV